MLTPQGRLTPNGMFFNAAQAFASGNGPAEEIRVYEKIRSGIWVYNGLFRLLDSWQEKAHGRQVFRFRLEICDEPSAETNGDGNSLQIDHTRLIPTAVKL